MAVVVRDRIHISDTDLAPVVQIIAWLLLGFVLLCMGTRVITTWVSSKRDFGIDDAFAVAATFLFVVETTCILLATSAGLAQSHQHEDENRLAVALKLEYAADILYFASLWTSKISIVLFLRAITPVRSHINVLWGTGVLTTVWLLIGLLGTAFQCSAPDRWNYINGQCISRSAFLEFAAVVNILTELPLVILPILITMPLKTKLSRRFSVMACFCSRIVVTGAAIGQLVEIPLFVSSSEPVLHVWPYQVCVQCVLALSIITSCIPHLRTFLTDDIEKLQAGALRVDDENVHRPNQRGLCNIGKPTRRAYHESELESRLSDARKVQRPSAH